MGQFDTKNAAAASDATPDPAVRTPAFPPCVKEEVGFAEPLLERMLSAHWVQEIAPPFVVGLVAITVWNDETWLRATAWVAVMFVANLFRMRARRRLLAATGVPAHRRLTVIRHHVWLAGACWALGVVLLAGDIPFDLLALTAMVFAGAIAVSTMTLIGDSRAFFGFAAVMLVTLMYGFARYVPDRAAVIGIFLVIDFTVASAAVYRTSHYRLLDLLRTTQELEASRAEISRERGYLGALLASAPVAIATVDPSSGIRSVNPRFEELFGFALDEARGRTLNDLIVPESELAAAHAMDRRLARGEVISAQIIRRRKDGSPVEVHASASRAGGLAEGVVFVAYDDISDLKRAERALREKNAQYRHLVESASDLVWQVDRDLRWTFLNAAALQVYGIAAERLVNTSFLDAVHPDWRDEDRHMLQRVLEGEEVNDHETVHLNAAGERTDMSFSARPLRDEANAIVGAHGTARDVSMRVAARLALEQGRLEAERIAQAKSAFLANMSHEIRTPMNGIMGMTELLLMTELTFEQRRQAEVIGTSASALLRIINDVLDFSKIEAGRMTLEHEPYDLQALVDSVVRPLALQAFRKGLEMVCDVAADVPRWVVGDSDRLRQVLNNLLGNAVKFTHHGELVVRITAGAGAGDVPGIRFVVSDTGIGIPAGQLDTIFEEFTQVDYTATRQYEGTGLGLTISRHLVRMMGGDLLVESELGRGSAFSFVLPLEPVTGVSAGAPAERALLRGRRVLVVDDNGASRAYHARVLAEAGMSVETTDSAADALARIRTAAAGGAAFAAAVVDARVPEYDGFQLAADVGRDPVTAPLRLLLLAEVGQPGDGQRCRELGISGYMTKPVTRDELIEAVLAIMTEGWSPDFLEEPLITRYSIEEARVRLRVLLVEDNAVNREVATAMLKQRGHVVVAVGNGRDAVDAARIARFDVVLMDLQMPVMDGIEAAREIRRDVRLAGLPIVAVTAHARPEERDRCQEAGMAGHVLKPFTPAELFAAIETPDVIRRASQEAGPPPAAAPIDYDGFAELMRTIGAAEAIEPTLEAFAHDMARRIRDLERAGTGDAAESIQTLARGGRSSAGAVRADALAAALGEIEAAVTAGKWSVVPALIGRVRVLFDAITRVLEAHGIRTVPP